MKTHQQMTDEKAWQRCQAGHKAHDTLVVDTEQGPMTVYDYEKYAGFDGYCSGQDDVSRTIINTGGWEKLESVEVRRVLEAGDRSKLFYDVGAHIGWYSRMAMDLGYVVHAFEADAENVELLRLNAPGVHVHYLWIDENTPSLCAADIELVKIDIEGSERHAMSMLKKSLLYATIRNIHMEVSPVFNDSYPLLVGMLERYGFCAFKNGEPFDHDYNFGQTNLLLTRR